MKVSEILSYALQLLGLGLIGWLGVSLYRLHRLTSDAQKTMARINKDITSLEASTIAKEQEASNAS